MARKKVDLKKEAAATAKGAEVPTITRAALSSTVPEHFRKEFAEAKTLGALVDLLKETSEVRLEINKLAKEFEEFEKKLKLYFIQELPNQKGAGATGIAGKKYRVQLQDKVSYNIAGSEEFYAYVKKNNAFDLLTRAVSAPAVEARLDSGKNIPGLGEFRYKSVSLTKI